MEVVSPAILVHLLNHCSSLHHTYSMCMVIAINDVHACCDIASSNGTPIEHCFHKDSLFYLIQKHNGNARPPALLK